MTSSAVGNVDAAQHIDEHLDGASFSGLKRRCEQLNILTDFEPSIDDELAHIQEMRVGKRQKKKLHDALRQRINRAIDRAEGAACQHGTSSTLDPTDGPGGAVLFPTTPPLDAPDTRRVASGPIDSAHLCRLWLPIFYKSRPISAHMAACIGRV